MPGDVVVCLCFFSSSKTLFYVFCVGFDAGEVWLAAPRSAVCH